MEQTSSPTRLLTIQQLEANIESQVIDLRHMRAKVEDKTQTQEIGMGLYEKQAQPIEDKADISEKAKTLALCATRSVTQKEDPEMVCKNLLDIKYRDAQRAYKSNA